jgi:hypothetical protein
VAGFVRNACLDPGSAKVPAIPVEHELHLAGDIVEHIRRAVRLYPEEEAQLTLTVDPRANRLAGSGQAECGGRILRR